LSIRFVTEACAGSVAHISSKLQTWSVNPASIAGVTRSFCSSQPTKCYSSRILSGVWVFEWRTIQMLADGLLNYISGDCYEVPTLA
jgi:hypothetical protein